MSEEKQSISFYLSKNLIKQLNKSANSVNMNRSQFAEWILTEALPLVPEVSMLMKGIFKASSKEASKLLGGE